MVIARSNGNASQALARGIHPWEEIARSGAGVIDKEMAHGPGG